MCDCQCLGFLTYAQMLMHAIACRGCADTERERERERECMRERECV